jgi:hypothetical protein
MPSAPGVSSEDAKKIKAKKEDAARKRKEKEARYKEKVKTETVEELVDVAALEQEFFQEGEWGPSWAHVEFVSVSSSIHRSDHRLSAYSPSRNLLL